MSDELMQKSFYGVVPSIVNSSEPHMACLLLVDTSGSMAASRAIDELNAGLNQFKEQVCQDKTTRDVLDVAVVAFNDTTRVVQDFVPVEYMEPVTLTAGGGTYMTPALRTAIDMVNQRARFYRHAGTEPYKPWIVMITDGMPLDSIDEVAAELHDLEEQEKLKIFSLGVDNYDPKALHKLCGPKVMKLRGHDFSSFFDWVNKSMRSVSVSTPGERPMGVPLPESVDKDTSDWM